MVDYAGVAQEVLAGLTEAGADGWIVKFTEIPGTGPMGDPVQTSTWHPVKVVWSQWSADEIDGTLIRANDRKALVSATGVRPEVSDQISMADGQQGDEIVSVREIAPAGQAVLYICNVRG